MVNMVSRARLREGQAHLWHTSQWLLDLLLPYPTRCGVGSKATSAPHPWRRTGPAVARVTCFACHHLTG